MKRHYTRLFPTTLTASLVLVAMLALAGTAFADSFDDAVAAYNRGDYATTLRLVRPLADQGDASAQRSLGLMYYRGHGVPQNYGEALKWFRKAADQGHADAQRSLGFMYYNGEGIPQNYTEALKWFRKAADQGLADAQHNLGVMYSRGEGVPQNYTEALKWFRKAADQGLADAQRSLGTMYYKGESVLQNHAEAVKWFRKAANQGLASAQRSLGYMYRKGKGVPQNYGAALRWSLKAADQGNAGAQADLGFMYAVGEGIPQNYGEAAKWSRKAADQGSAAAQANLGEMYYKGEGVPQNHAEAAKWYRKAADQGHAEAQNDLGTMYYKGEGVPKDYVYAYMWLSLSAAQGNQRAATSRDLAAKVMTPAQIAEAQRFARGKTGSPKVARQEDKVEPPPRTAPSKVVSTGTGFFVSEAGQIVTNAHVVDGCRIMRSSRGGALKKVSTDEESDLALYAASEKPDAVARLRGGRGARAGESVVAVGFPLRGLLSSDPIVTTGIISALSGLRNDRRKIQTTAPVQPGNSGGPLLGENGSVVGVVASKLNAVRVAEATGDIPQNVNFAVSLGTLQSFLNANGVPYSLDESKATKSPADIAAEATRYTVLLESEIARKFWQPLNCSHDTKGLRQIPMLGPRYFRPAWDARFAKRIAEWSAPQVLNVLKRDARPAAASA